MRAAHELASGALTGNPEPIPGALQTLHAIALVDPDTILGVVALYSTALQDLQIDHAVSGVDLVRAASSAYGEAFSFSDEDFEDVHTSAAGFPPVDDDGAVDILRWSVGLILLAAAAGVLARMPVLSFTLAVRTSAQLRFALDAPPLPSPLADGLEEL